jgi:integrase
LSLNRWLLAQNSCSELGAGLVDGQGAGLERIHQVRHTFCSHLAMRGAPAKAIQELAGHADLTTTMRYMHLSPASLNQAIRMLEQRGAIGGNSEATIVEKN